MWINEGNNTKVGTTTSYTMEGIEGGIEECQKLCDQWQLFKCVSFEYGDKDVCKMSAQTAEDLGVVLEESDDFTLVSRYCDKSVIGQYSAFYASVNNYYHISSILQYNIDIFIDIIQVTHHESNAHFGWILYQIIQRCTLLCSINNSS